MSDLLQSTLDHTAGRTRNSIFNLDPSKYFTKPEMSSQSDKDLNRSTTTLRPTSTLEGSRRVLQTKKTSSLVMDDLNESSVLFQSGLGPSESTQPREPQPDRQANRRQTLKIFEQNRQIAKAQELQRQEEVGRAAQSG